MQKLTVARRSEDFIVTSSRREGGG